MEKQGVVVIRNRGPKISRPGMRPVPADQSPLWLLLLFPFATEDDFEVLIMVIPNMCLKIDREKEKFSLRFLIRYKVA